MSDATLAPRCLRTRELGAEPPIGAIFGLPTVMDDSLTDQDQVTFQAGTHADAVTITLTDYQRIAQPGISHFCAAVRSICLQAN